MLREKDIIDCQSANSWTCSTEGDMSAATTQQRLLYVRRNQATETRKQIAGLQHELVNLSADLIVTKLLTFWLLKVIAAAVCGRCS